MLQYTLEWRLGGDHSGALGIYLARYFRQEVVAVSGLRTSQPVVLKGDDVSVVMIYDDLLVEDVITASIKRHL